MRLTLIKHRDENNKYDLCDVRHDSVDICTREDMLTVLEDFMRSCGFVIPYESLIVEDDSGQKE